MIPQNMICTLVGQIFSYAIAVSFNFSSYLYTGTTPETIRHHYLLFAFGCECSSVNHAPSGSNTVPVDLLTWSDDMKT